MISPKPTSGPEQFRDCLSSDGAPPHWDAAAEMPTRRARTLPPGFEDHIVCSEPL